jgi:hypothetical protein
MRWRPSLDLRLKCSNALWWQPVRSGGGRGLYSPQPMNDLQRGSESGSPLQPCQVACACQRSRSLPSCRCVRTKLDVRGHDYRQGQAAGSPPYSHCTLPPTAPHRPDPWNHVPPGRTRTDGPKRKEEKHSGRRRGNSKHRSSENWTAKRMRARMEDIQSLSFPTLPTRRMQMTPITTGEFTYVGSG